MEQPGVTLMTDTQVSAEDLGAETMVSILRGAVVYARENKEGRGPPMITLGDASRAADIIERVTRERDAARREAATFRHDTSVALAALDDAKKLAVRQATQIKRLAAEVETLQERCS